MKYSELVLTFLDVSKLYYSLPRSGITQTIISNVLKHPICFDHSTNIGLSLTHSEKVRVLGSESKGFMFQTEPLLKFISEIDLSVRYKKQYIVTPGIDFNNIFEPIGFDPFIQENLKKIIKFYNDEYKMGLNVNSLVGEGLGIANDTNLKYFLKEILRKDLDRFFVKDIYNNRSLDDFNMIFDSMEGDILKIDSLRMKINARDYLNEHRILFEEGIDFSLKSKIKRAEICENMITFKIKE